MERLTLQIILALFSVFAISRVWLRFRAEKLGWFGFIFWAGLFGVGLVMIIFPDLTVFLAHQLGIGRGADFIVYISIVILFYLVYRLYVFLDDIRNDITKIVREQAIRSSKKPR